MNYIVTIGFLRHQYPAVAHIVTHSVNLAFRPNSGIKTMSGQVRACGFGPGSAFEMSLVYNSAAMFPECPTKDWRGMSCWLHRLEGGPDVVQGPGEVITSQTLLCLILVCSQ